MKKQKWLILSLIIGLVMSSLPSAVFGQSISETSSFPAITANAAKLKLVSDNHYLYQLSGGNVLRSQDGVLWETVFVTEVTMGSDLIVSGNKLYINSRQGSFQSDDHGQTWTKLELEGLEAGLAAVYELNGETWFFSHKSYWRRHNGKVTKGQFGHLGAATPTSFYYYKGHYIAFIAGDVYKSIDGAFWSKEQLDPFYVFHSSLQDDRLTVVKRRTLTSMTLYVYDNYDPSKPLPTPTVTEINGAYSQIQQIGNTFYYTVGEQMYRSVFQTLADVVLKRDGETSIASGKLSSATIIVWQGKEYFCWNTTSAGYATQSADGEFRFYYSDALGAGSAPQSTHKQIVADGKGTIVAIQPNGTMFISKDSGQTWKSQSIGARNVPNGASSGGYVPGVLHSIYYENGHFYAVTTYSEVWQSSDGLSWNKTSLLTPTETRQGAQFDVALLNGKFVATDETSHQIWAAAPYFVRGLMDGISYSVDGVQWTKVALNETVINVVSNGKEILIQTKKHLYRTTDFQTLTKFEQTYDEYKTSIAVVDGDFYLLDGTTVYRSTHLVDWTVAVKNVAQYAVLQRNSAQLLATNGIKLQLLTPYNVKLTTLTWGTQVIEPGQKLVLPDASVRQLEVTAIAEDPTAKVTIQSPLLQPEIENEVAVKVASADGIVTKDYRFTVVRPKSSDTTIKTLTVNGLALQALYTETTGKLALELNDDRSTATVTLNKQRITGESFTLQQGNNELAIVVTAESGVTKEYRYTLKYEPLADNAALSTLRVGDDLPFKAEQTTYSLNVPFDVTNIPIHATPADAKATVQWFINGVPTTNANVALPLGSTLLKVVVTAANGKTGTYTVQVNRLARPEVIPSTPAPLLPKAKVMIGNRAVDIEINDNQLIIGESLLRQLQEAGLQTVRIELPNTMKQVRVKVAASSVVPTIVLQQYEVMIPLGTSDVTLQLEPTLKIGANGFVYVTLPIDDENVDVVSERGIEVATVNSNAKTITTRINGEATLQLAPKVQMSVSETKTKAEAQLTSDVTAQYQWYRYGQPIKGATSATYTFTKEDRGTSLTVVATIPKTKQTLTKQTGIYGVRGEVYRPTKSEQYALAGTKLIALDKTVEAGTIPYVAIHPQRFIVQGGYTLVNAFKRVATGYEVTRNVTVYRLDGRVMKVMKKGTILPYMRVIPALYEIADQIYIKK